MWERNRRDLDWEMVCRQKQFDLVIVGGGITGAGILREAARLGLHTLMVEQNDFASGTSSRSSKLVHGGLRYLKEGRLLLTRDSVIERERLLKECQGLVKPLYFLMADYRGQKPSRWAFSAGLTIYDLIAGQWDHQYLSSLAFQKMAPHMSSDGLNGGLRYKDAQADDVRLVLRLILEACEDGATAINYVKAQTPERKDGAVCGLTLVDQISGEEVFVQTKVVINATGAWADRMRGSHVLRPLRGSHLIFPRWRLPAPQAMTIIHPRDQRFVYLLPWEGVTVFGTTDKDHDADLDIEAQITAEEVDYLMEALADKMPALNLTKDDIICGFAGVRPVISHGKQVAPSKESRDHEIWDEDGLISITGGKLTTFRHMAFDLLKVASHYYEDGLDIDRSSPVFKQGTLPANSEVEPNIVRFLLGRYGEAATMILKDAKPEHLSFITGTETLWAELPWIAAHEGIVHLEDLLLRRVRIGMCLPEGGRQHLPKIRQLCQKPLGWDDATWEAEEQRYLERWQFSYAIPATTEV